MSSPFSTALLARARSDHRSLVGLAKVEISTPSALTLYLGESEVLTPDGQLWEGGLTLDTIYQEVPSLGTGPSPASTTIAIENRRYSFQSSTATIGDSLSSYLWQGATVTIYLWDRDLTDFADACQRFSGIVDSYELGDERLTLNCLQDRSWNRPHPTLVVDKTNYPNAPDGQQGAVIPTVYGSHIAWPLRSPHTAGYTNKQYHEDSGAGQGAIPLVLTDPGTGSADVQLVAASHACGDLLDRANGYSAFIVANDVLAPLDTAGITETLSGPSYLTIDDDSLIAYYGARAIDVRTTGAGTVNSALNPRRAMDVFDETSYATLNQTAGTDQEKLVLVGPNLGSLGTIESATVIMCFSGDAANTQNIRVYPEELGVTFGTVISTASTGTTPQIVTGTWDTAYYNASTWQFGTKPSTGGQCCWSIDFAGASANNKARVYWVAIRVKYRPSRNLLTPAIITGQVSMQQERPFVPFLNTYLPNGQYYTPPTLQQSGQFYANIKGYVDDGGGTYTGTASAVIERPCDIIRHFLTTYGGASSFETASGGFGSFVDARNKLRNATPNDFKLACWLGEASSVQRYVQKMAEQSLLCIVQDVFTNKWLCHVWKQGAAPDYDLVLTRNELPDLFEPSLTSSVSLAQGVRVRYGYDYFRNRTMFEAYVGASGSSQGYNFPTIRDQVLTVDSTNNKLDWVTSSNTTTWGASAPYTYAETLTSATYAPIDLASHIRGKMYARMLSATRYLQVGFGFTVKASYNDWVEFSYGASSYSFQLDPGDYTAELLASTIASKMNAAAGVSNVIGCTYSHTTNKFTFTTTGSNTAFLAIGSCAHPTMQARWLFGLTLSTSSNSWTSGGPLTSTDACYADRFWFRGQTTAQFALKFATGASVATSCNVLLGFPVADSAEAANHVATYARGQRETTCATSQSLYGPRADSTITADWIRDEASAQQRRDREFDYGSAPRVRLRARSPFMADLQVMRVLSVSSDMDSRRAYPKYGTDGSWENKPMRVTKVVHYHAPTYHTEFEAEEA